MQLKEPKWKPNYGDKYYFIDENGIQEELWDGVYFDNFLYEIGNCFKTREEAAFELERLKVIAKMKEYSFDPNWDDEYQPKYILVFDHKRKVVDNIHNPICQCCDIVFESEDTCKRCVREVGEDKIKKYYFRIKEI